VIVGEGKTGNSATLVMGLTSKAHVSQNTKCYWCVDVYLGLSLTIFKDTDEGATLETMLKDGTSAEDVLRWLQLTVLENAPSHQIHAAVMDAIEAAKEEGKDEKAMEMRKVLGL
jgi:hypothetical protein